MMNQKNRENGWYWVKCIVHGWVVAGFDGQKWISTYWVGRKEDSFFNEIDERRIVREEPTE